MERTCRCWMKVGEGVSWDLRELLTHHVCQASYPSAALIVRGLTTIE